MKTFAQFIEESLASVLFKGAARQALRRQGIRAAVKRSTGALPKKLKVQTPTKNITGFRTGGKNRGAGFDPMKGSKYQFTPATSTTPARSTPFTAPGHISTPAGRKPTTDLTVFTSKQNAAVLRQQRLDAKDWNTGQRLTGKSDWKKVTNLETGKKEVIPTQNRPEKGLSPVEVWDKYPKGVEYKHGVFSKGGERMTHVGSPIVDIQTRKAPGALPMFGADRKELAQRVKAELQRQKAALKKAKVEAKPTKSSSGYEYGKEGRVTAKDVDVFSTRQRTGGYGEPNATRGGKPGVGQTKTVATLTGGEFAGATPISRESRRVLKKFAKSPNVGQNPLRGEPGTGAELTQGQMRIRKKIAKKIQKKYGIGAENNVTPSPRTPAAKDAFRDMAEFDKAQAIKKKGYEDLSKAIDDVVPPSKPPTSSSPSSTSPTPKKKKKGSKTLNDLLTFAGGSAVGGYAGAKEDDDVKENYVYEEQTPARPQVSDHQAELERLRGAATLKSLGDSPRWKRLLAGKGRNQRSNEIVTKSIERSGLNRDELVKASPERYGKMVDFASKTNAERAAIGRQVGQSMARAIAPKLPNVATPKKTENTPKMSDFAAGGGNAKMKATGMTRDQVIALGQKNLANKKVTNTKSSDDTMAKVSPAPTKPATPAPTKVSPAPKTETPKAGLTDAQLKQYQRAYDNRNNPFAKGTIKKAYAGLTPEQQKAFQAHAKSQGHDWGGLI